MYILSRLSLCGMVFSVFGCFSAIDRELSHAIVNGDLVRLQDLINIRGVDLNARDVYGDTVFNLAINSNHAEIIPNLVAAGADINAHDSRGFTILHQTALQAQQTSILSILVAAGADINARDIAGNTPLHLVAQEPWLLDNLLALIGLNANLNAQNNDGNTPLHCAASFGWGKNVQALIAAGANMELLNSEGLTSEQCANRFGHDNVADYIGACLLRVQGIRNRYRGIASNFSMAVMVPRIGEGSPAQTLTRDSLQDIIMEEMQEELHDAVQLSQPIEDVL